MPRFATIDVGSSSVLLHVADRRADGTFSAVLDESEITRLADGLDQSRRLGQEGMARTLGALAGFLEHARQHQVEAHVAVGTMALRVAQNAAVFVERAARELGLEIEVIPGEEEARLSYLAARSSLPLASEPWALFDIGGGSTEVIFAGAAGIEHRVSLPLGALTLTERHLRSDPPTADELDRLRGWLDAELAPLACEGARPVVGLGGAVTTLAAVELGCEPYAPERVHGLALTSAQIERQIALYRSLSVSQRRSLAGLHPRRADTILAGAAIALALVRRLGTERLMVCDRGIRHGLLVDRFG